MTSSEPLAEDIPFRTEELGDNRVIVRFAEYVDHRRTPDLDGALIRAMRKHNKVACDFSTTKEVDSDWLTLVAAITVEGKEAGKRVGVVGLSPTLKDSADVLGLSSLKHFASVEEVWK